MVSKNLSVCLSVINFDLNYLFYKRLFDLSSNQNQKLIKKIFARLAARAVFGSPFILQKQLIYDFLSGNNYPDRPHLQGGMKFATQISQLLNYFFDLFVSFSHLLFKRTSEYFC